jgi:hypothetical protein
MRASRKAILRAFPSLAELLTRMLSGNAIPWPWRLRKSLAVRNSRRSPLSLLDSCTLLKRRTYDVQYCTTTRALPKRVTTRSGVAHPLQSAGIILPEMLHALCRTGDGCAACVRSVYRWQASGTSPSTLLNCSTASQVARSQESSHIAQLQCCPYSRILQFGALFAKSCFLRCAGWARGALQACNVYRWQMRGMTTERWIVYA